MLKELLGAVEKPNGRPLLIVLVAISMVVVAPADHTLLTEPLQPALLALPIAVMFAYGLLWIWFSCVHNLNHRLQDNDIGSWGPILGCSVLAGCLLVSFNYLATHPQGLSLDRKSVV